MHGSLLEGTVDSVEEGVEEGVEDGVPMRVFAIADPHLSRLEPKPMDVFGDRWEGHPEAFFDSWRRTVGAGDLVLVPGDISWAMHFEDALVDLAEIAALPGKKVLLRGNHDYWWPSISKLRAGLPEGMFAVQNDALEIEGVIVAGTRGWVCPGSRGYEPKDEKIYRREVERLKLSLRAAERLEGRFFVVMMHFPPTNPWLERSEFVTAIEATSPDALVFGHVHGGDEPVLAEMEGVDVHFVAADALDFVPKQIATLR